MRRADLLKRLRTDTRRIIRWYFEEGRSVDVPLYCDPSRVGAFAISPEDLAAGADAALFRVFVTLSMYQALRDVVIMRQQRSQSRDPLRGSHIPLFHSRSPPVFSLPSLRS